MLPGDFDGKNGVDFGDFLRLSGNFGNPAANYGHGDINLDGRTDYDPAGLVGDLGCRDPEWVREDPACQDGADNDDDETIDFDGGASLNGGTPIAAADPTCGQKSFKNRESPKGCGLGFELVLLLPLAALVRQRLR